MNASQYDLAQLNQELEAALVNFRQYHTDMDSNFSFYERSAFYPSVSGQTRKSTDLKNNLLRVYADANINFTCAFPTIKVTTTGATPEQRQSASIREKILLAVWKKSGGQLLQRKWAFDATVRSVAIAETGYDIQNRCAFVKRYDPRYCFWQVSNGNDGTRVVAFWAVWPITRDEAKSRYGVEPDSQPISTGALTDSFLKSIDGKDWFMMAIRWDGQIRTAWIGNKLVEEPHMHQMGGVPIDIVEPFESGNEKGQGAFYLEPMLTTQAELNLTLQRRSAIVGRMSNPVVWVKGMISRQLDDVKSGLKGGGMIGMKTAGEIGILQLNDVKLLNEHEDALRHDMMQQSGFSAAAMGELAGANTSGDALGMYFTPTQRHIEKQNIAWVAFYESINSKILRVTERFTKTGEQISLTGYAPSGTVLPMADNPDKMEYQSGAFDIKFTREVIGGNYSSTVIMNAITPKNELEEKRLVVEAATQKFISRTTAFEMYGIESPEDELALLTQEQSEPALNPDGMNALVAAASKIPGNQPPAASPSPTPVAQDVKQNVR